MKKGNSKSTGTVQASRRGHITLYWLPTEPMLSCWGWADSLTTPDGLKVSVKMEHGKITELEIVNTSAEKRDIHLALPGQDETKLVLKNGGKFKIR